MGAHTPQLNRITPGIAELITDDLQPAIFRYRIRSRLPNGYNNKQKDHHHHSCQF